MLPHFREFVTILSAVLLLVTMSRDVFAQDLRAALKPLAEKTLQLLKEKGQTRVAVGDFIGPPQLESHTGTGISNTLIQLLNEGQPKVVSRRSSVAIRGRYDSVQSRDSNGSPMTYIRVTSQLTDSNGNLIPGGEVSTEVRDSAEVAGMLNLTVSFDPLQTAAQRNRQVGLALETVRPGGALQDDLAEAVQTGAQVSPVITPGPTAPADVLTQLRPRKGSPFAIEILAAPKSAAPQSASEWSTVQARPLRDEEGLYYVDLERDEVYAVRLFNEGDVDAAVYLEIDGLNSFAFSDLRNAEGRPLYSYSILEKGPAGNCRHFVGWHRTNESSDSFLITEYGKGATAFNLPEQSPGQTGVITVKFAPAWPPGTQPAGIRAGSQLETGKGPAVQSKQIVLNRTIGPVSDVVSIRYSR